MKKIVISCLAIFLLAGCDGQKEYPDIAKKLDRIDSVLKMGRMEILALPEPFHVSFRLNASNTAPKLRVYKVVGTPQPMGVLVYKLMLPNNIIYVGNYPAPDTGEYTETPLSVAVGDKFLLLPYYGDYKGSGVGYKLRDGIPGSTWDSYQFKPDEGGSSSIMVSTMGLVP